MKIKEIILEGFKSYSERTTLSELDPQFNAITGLNGSGKSNILEGICFVLGLQSWTLARVQTIRELIYKNGQAGIKQASVTIVFCNKDKRTSPVGLEDQDEIKVTRLIKHDQTLYYLNSKKIPNNRIRTIFKSIGLNIDNYNTFFVQQGRIMSIVNFHPKELMGFIEETAGVSYYNQVKENCITTLEKKDDKLKRVDEIFEGDVKEDLERLEKEVENLRAWKKNEQELKRVIARQRHFERKLAQDESEKLEREIVDFEEALKQIKRNVSENTHRLNEIVKELQKEKIIGETKSQPLEDEVKKLRDEFDKMEREQARQRESRRKLEEESTKLEMNLLKGKHAYENLIERKRNLEWKSETQTENVKKIKLELDNLKLVSGQNKEKVGDFFQKNLKSLHADLQNQQNQLQTISRQILTEESNLESLSYQKGNSETLKQNYSKSLEEKEFQKRALEKNLAKLESQLTDENSLRRKLGEFEAKVSELHQRRRQLTNNNNNVFEILFNNNRHLLPEKSVYGRVHELFSVRDYDFLACLETIAGNKIYFIVIENEDIGQKIIEKAIIKGRNDFIPNNKVVTRNVDPQAFAMAQSIAKRMGESIWNPLDLIDFRPDLRRTFDFVFGDKIICSSLELAREIAFHPDIRRICVTKEGDSVNPGGLLEGGYSPEGLRFLPRAMKYREISAELEKTHRQHDESERELQLAREAKETLRKVRSDLTDLKQNIEELRAKINDCKVGEIGLLFENTRKRIADLVLDEQARKQDIGSLKTKIEELKRDIGRNDVNQATILETQIANRRQELLNLESSLREQAKELEMHRIDIDSLKNEEEETIEEIAKVKVSVEQAKANLAELGMAKEALAGKLKVLEEKLQESNKLRQKLERKNAELLSEKMEIESDLARWQEDLLGKTESILKTRKLLQEFKQRLHDKSMRFSQEIQEEENELPLDELLERINSLEKRKEFLEKEQQQLIKRVNKDCDTEFNKLKEKYLSVNNMKEQVLENRSVLLTNIDGLDQKKKSAVEMCFIEVNKNLGLIFSSLLPGAFAEMKIVDLFDKRSQGKYQGIEIRISFNGKWKESLAELSGGQRSLLALSFLLAMLRYRPAPFYILDEVDAALDLSHTENLGALISRHFPQSQFLVISLKDELFNNANVLFKTSVFEGRSRIERFNMRSVKLAG